MCLPLTPFTCACSPPGPPLCPAVSSLVPAVTYTRFALCGKCYSAEIAGHGKGLPAGMQLRELLPAPNQHIPPNHDTVQEMENEHFDTRMVGLVDRVAVQG